MGNEHDAQALAAEIAKLRAEMQIHTRKMQAVCDTLNAASIYAAKSAKWIRAFHRAAAMLAEDFRILLAFDEDAGEVTIASILEDEDEDDEGPDYGGPGHGTN